MRPLTEPTTFTPAFSDRCINCYQETVDLIYLKHYLRTFTVEEAVCPGCISDVIFHRPKDVKREDRVIGRKHKYPCRNVSDMTKELRDINDWKLHREMGNKLVPYKAVNHI
jgi:hypothetical protein